MKWGDLTHGFNPPSKWVANSSLVSLGQERYVEAGKREMVRVINFACKSFRGSGKQFIVSAQPSYKETSMPLIYSSIRPCRWTKHLPPGNSWSIYPSATIWSSSLLLMALASAAILQGVSFSKLYMSYSVSRYFILFVLKYVFSANGWCSHASRFKNIALVHGHEDQGGYGLWEILVSTTGSKRSIISVWNDLIWFDYWPIIIIKSTSWFDYRAYNHNHNQIIWL